MSIYSVEIEVHYEGIVEYHLFGDIQAAKAWANEFMASQLPKVFKADSYHDRGDDMIVAWAGDGEDVVIRRKSLTK